MTAPSAAIRYPTTDITDQGNRPGDGPLRAGGKPAPQGLTASTEANLPSTLSKSAARQRKGLELVRDVSAGTEKIRDRTIVYLPQAPGEHPIVYRSRLLRSVFFNVFAHTIEGLVGQVFRRDPILGDDVPPVIAGTDTQPGHWENIDLAGTHGDVFCRDLLQDSLTSGHAAILVDFPVTGGTQRADQEQQGIRPYWVPILKDNILSWRTTVEHGRTILTQLVLRECQTVPDGEFGDMDQTQYRVLYRDSSGVTPIAGFRLLRITDDKRIIEVASGLYGNQDEIPVAEIATSGRVSLFESAPPLLDLAYVNVVHYQTLSDYLTSVHMTCVPLLTLIAFDDVGGDAGQVVVGPSSVLTSSNPLAKAAYVSHDGRALGEVKQALDDLKSDMGTLGLSMLSPSKRTAETAQAKRLDKATEDSALAVTARGLQDGIERALGFHGRYLDGKPEGGSVTINKEFDTQQMEATLLTAWTQAVATAGVPERLMLKAMQIGELISPDEDIDDIAQEMASNAAAIADQKQQAAMDQLAVKAGQQPAAKQPIPKPS